MSTKPVVVKTSIAVLKPNQARAVQAVQRLTRATVVILGATGRRPCRAQTILRVLNSLRHMEQRPEDTPTEFVASWYFRLTFKVEGKRITLRG